MSEDDIFESTMPTTPFDSLPDDSRLWVFGAGRRLSAAESAAVLERVDEFLTAWAAHGEPLTCGRAWRHDRFLLVAVDERSVPPSGCSIDAMVDVLKELQERLATSLVDQHRVWFREGAEVQCVERAGFRELAEAGRVGPETIVFDQTVTRLGRLRAGDWERPAGETWHRRAFFSTKV
jgi:hypothetical protein